MDLAVLLQSLGIPPSVLIYVTTAITVASALDAVLPHTTTPIWLARARNALGWFALSFGHAKPAGAVAASAAIASPTAPPAGAPT